MLNRIVAFIAVLVSTAGVQASTLKGIVLTNQLGGKPVAKVSISAPGANQTESDANGSFTLVFPKAQPGDRVQL
jgi:hypothetical protein